MTTTPDEAAKRRDDGGATAEPMQCECINWARQFNLADRFGNGHHERCAKFVPYVGVASLLKRMIAGIKSWADDEDGVHPDLWEDYREAVLLLEGRMLPEDPDNDRPRPPAAAEPGEERVNLRYGESAKVGDLLSAGGPSIWRITSPPKSGRLDAEQWYGGQWRPSLGVPSANGFGRYHLATAAEIAEAGIPLEDIADEKLKAEVYCRRISVAPPAVPPAPAEEQGKCNHCNGTGSVKDDCLGPYVCSFCGGCGCAPIVAAPPAGEAEAKAWGERFAEGLEREASSLKRAADEYLTMFKGKPIDVEGARRDGALLHTLARIARSV